MSNLTLIAWGLIGFGSLSVLGTFSEAIKPTTSVKKEDLPKILIMSLLTVIIGLGLTLIDNEPEATTAPPTAEAKPIKKTIHGDSAAIAKVRATKKGKKGMKFRTAPFEEGVAVIADNAGGYWVDDKGEVFATNGIAKEWSPKVNWSREGVDYMSTEKIIGSRYSTN